MKVHVIHTDGSTTITSRHKAQGFVRRNRAVWTSHDTIQLLLSAAQPAVHHSPNLHIIPARWQPCWRTTESAVLYPQAEYFAERSAPALA